MADALIQIVDENDTPTGQATKQEAWDKGLIHRIVRIMIENDKGQILLQHRHPGKTLYPNCWDHSASGHVDAGETYDIAAARELKEELGISGVKLRLAGSYFTDRTWRGRRLKRFSKVYKVTYNQTPQQLQATEVDDVRWFTLAQIKALLRDHPDQVTDGLRQVIERYY